MILDRPIARTRILAPRRRANLLTRQRLVDSMFELSDKKLILIVAPAGYGKTSLLIDFSDKIEFPVCWYSISSHDQDPLRFFSHFISSIQVKFPAFGQSSLTALHNASQGSLDLNYLVTTVINDAYENITEHFIITLEDFHLVDDVDPISEFISDFVQNVDDNCTLVITSRKLLTLPDMTLLVARDLVGGLSYEELAFTPQEIQQLFLQSHQQSLTDQTAQNFFMQTEGWITGLLLSSQINEYLGSSGTIVKRIANIGVHDYFAALLEQQPPSIQDFLLRTSLLEEFNEGFCKQVIEDALALTDINWRQMMEYVVQRNLFVMPVGSEGDWLRYHRIFLDFLQNHMQANRPEEVRKIHLHLAQVYIAQQEWELAYQLYQQLNKSQEILNLIEQAGPDLIASGRLELLHTWLSAVPPEVIQHHPPLLSLYGGVLSMQGNPQNGINLLDQAIQAMHYPEDKHYLVRSLVRRSAIHRLTGNLAAAQRDSEEVLALIAQDDSLNEFKAEALRSKGVCLFQQGALSEAVRWLYESLTAFQAAGDQHNQYVLAMEIGVVEQARGRYKESKEMYLQAYGYWDKTTNSVWLANLLNNLGVLQQLTGEYEQAAASFEKAYHHARISGFSRMQAFTLTGIGDVYREVNAIDEALAAYHQARPIAEDINEKFLLTYLDLEEASLVSQQADTGLASHLLQCARERAESVGTPLEQHMTSLELSGHLLWTGQPEKALLQLPQELTYFTSEGHQYQIEKTHLYLAIACAENKQYQEAAEHFMQVMAYAVNFERRNPLITNGWGIKDTILKLGESPEASPQILALVQRIEMFEQQIPKVRKELRKYAAAIPFAPPKIYIQSLGKMQVRINDHWVTSSDWKTSDARDLFFLLLAHSEGLNKDQIALHFWPDASPSEIRFRIKNTLYRLRHAIGKETILLEDDYYVFNHDTDYEYDLESFQSEIVRAKKASIPAEAIQHLENAVACYHGPFLYEIEDTWILSAREHLQQNYLGVLIQLAEYYLSERNYAKAQSFCQQALKTDPCFEVAYRMSMRVHAAQGNRAGVVRQYEQCKSILMKEIDVPPSPQTHELFLTLTR